MKKVFLIILLFVSMKSFSQAYTPMNFDTSCYWVNSLNIYFGGTTCSGSLVSYIEKDTLINVQQYFKMTNYASTIDVGGNCVKGFNGSLFVREDTFQRKIYKYIGGNLEEVLVDFNLNTGDTLKIGIGHFHIDSISTDTIFGNSRRRQWYHTLLGGKQSTIEGIGNSINFPYGGYYGEWDTPYFQLQCYGKNGTIYFGQQNCTKTAPASLILLDKSNISLNFSENILTVKNNTEPFILSVFNLFGNEVFTEKTDDNHYSKDLSSILQNGFYIVTVHDKKNKSVLKVFIQ